MKKLIILGSLLVVGGVCGLVVAHHYRPLPAGYFVSGVPGVPTRLSNANYGLAIGGAGVVIFIGIVVGGFGVIQLVRGSEDEESSS